MPDTAAVRITNFLTQIFTTKYHIGIDSAFFPSGVTWPNLTLLYVCLFFPSGVTELALNWAFVAKIWVPDTYIVNGKKSYLHKITVPNRFIRISPNGRVSYSQVNHVKIRLGKPKLPGFLKGILG